MSRHRTSRRSRSLLGLLSIIAGLLLIGLLAIFIFLDDKQKASPRPMDAMPVSVNYPAPDLRLDDLSGGQVSLEDYLGQVILVNLWATWCPPCKAEMPVLQAYYEAHKRQGFALVAINAGDPPEDVEAFVQTIGLTFPVWLDPQSAATRAFRTAGLPSSYVIDRSGQIRLAWSGAVERETLEKYVTPLINQ